MRAPSITKKILNFLWLIGIYESSESRSSKSPKSYSDILERATKVINDRRLYLNDNLSMSWLSKETGTNRTYLSRAFNENGVSYYDFINRLRVNTARSLIEKCAEKNQSLMLEDLSVMCGFGSSRALIRHFKNVTGTTPSGYYKYLVAERATPPPQSDPDEDSV